MYKKRVLWSLLALSVALVSFLINYNNFSKEDSTENHSDTAVYTDSVSSTNRSLQTAQKLSSSISLSENNDGRYKSFDFSDSKGNQIRLIVSNRIDEDNIQMVDGVMPDERFLEKYKVVTNGFIKTDDALIGGIKMVSMKTQDSVRYVYQYVGTEETFKRIPFDLDDGELVQFRPAVIGEPFIFSIVHDKNY